MRIIFAIVFFWLCHPAKSQDFKWGAPVRDSSNYKIVKGKSGTDAEYQYTVTITQKNLINNDILERVQSYSVKQTLSGNTLSYTPDKYSVVYKYKKPKHLGAIKTNINGKEYTDSLETIPFATNANTAPGAVLTYTLQNRLNTSFSLTSDTISVNTTSITATLSAGANYSTTVLNVSYSKPDSTFSFTLKDDPLTIDYGGDLKKTFRSGSSSSASIGTNSSITIYSVSPVTFTMATLIKTLTPVKTAPVICSFTLSAAQFTNSNARLNASFKRTGYSVAHNVDLTITKNPNGSLRLSIPATTLESTFSIKSTRSFTLSTVKEINKICTITSTNVILPLSVFTCSTVPPPSPVTITIDDSKRRDIYESILFLKKVNPGRFYVSFGFLPSVSNRRVLINTSTYNNTDFLLKKDYQESPTFDVSYNLKLGLRVHKRHIFYLEGIFLNQGFKTNYDSINPFTGLTDVSYKAQRYGFTSLATGLGYSYNPYVTNRHLFYCMESSLYYSHFLYMDKRNPLSDRLSVKLACGLSYKPNYRHDVKFMPAIIYDLSAINKSGISTRLLNIGLMVSYGISLGNFQ